MAFGPGKYDDLATAAREQVMAEGVVVLVINGTRGSGFSAQLTARLQRTLPTILRSIADEIDEKGSERD